MNKISIKTIMFFILLITTNIACNSITPTDNNLNSNRSSEQTKYPIDILDSNEENIRIYEPVQKMIVLDSAAVEILFAIGEGDKIVGTHSFISHPEEAKQIAKVGDAFSINIEKIIEQEPDLVYIFFDKFAEELNKNI